jgi:hypothetical protein
MSKPKTPKEGAPRSVPEALPDDKLDGVQGGFLEQFRGGTTEPSSKETTTTTDSRSVPEAFR